MPVVSLSKEVRDSVSHVSLVKGYDAATEALRKVGLLGIQMRFIFLLDGSGSMSQDYASSAIWTMLTRGLGFALNCDLTKRIAVIVYGTNVSKPVYLDMENYQNASRLIKPPFSFTNMADAIAEARALAATYDLPTIICNLTDGNPMVPGRYNAEGLTTDQFIASSGEPVLIKNWAIRPVTYLKTVDDLPSYYEIRKDCKGNPILDASGNLIFDINPAGVRLIDNVDSKAFNPDPRVTSVDELAFYMADEVNQWLEASGRVGIITGVPGIERTFF
ncbi:MAG: VWA domain-containing protein [Candidatus Woesebacteria bacterium]|jgi:hypothetical protein